MKKTVFFLCSMIFTLQLHATETFSSEASHFAGAAVLAGVSTAVVDQFEEYKKNRKMIGFGISAIYGLIDQSIQYEEHGNAGGQLLDLGAHLLGSALGAWMTDKYILSPVIESSELEGKYLGFAMEYSF